MAWRVRTKPAWISKPHLCHQQRWTVPGTENIPSSTLSRIRHQQQLEFPGCCHLWGPTACTARASQGPVSYRAWADGDLPLVTGGPACGSSGAHPALALPTVSCPFSSSGPRSSLSNKPHMTAPALTPWPMVALPVSCSPWHNHPALKVIVPSLVVLSAPQSPLPSLALHWGL